MRKNEKEAVVNIIRHMQALQRQITKPSCAEATDEEVLKLLEMFWEWRPVSRYKLPSKHTIEKLVGLMRGCQRCEYCYISRGDVARIIRQAARRLHSGHGYELFADFDAWIKQDVLEKSSIRPLYEEWIAKGWLHASPGAVFQPSLFVTRFDELLQKGCQFQYFGYDPYQSKDPINTLKAFLQEHGVAHPDAHVIPVSQRNAWFNAPTDDLARAIKSPIPYITFSANPMWPWLFGNCVLSIDGKGGSSADMDLGNKKPVKRNPGSDSCKVDPIQCVVEGMGLFTQFEGQKR